jgi:hypothetical protein
MERRLIAAEDADEDAVELPYEVRLASLVY